MALEGFIIHLYADLRRDAMFMAGRLADGRSFAIRDSLWRPPVYVDSGLAERAGSILGTDVVFAPCNYMSFEGRPVYETRIPKLSRFARSSSASRRWLAAASGEGERSMLAEAAATRVPNGRNS